jgi:hypothetical protein
VESLFWFSSTEFIGSVKEDITDSEENVVSTKFTDSVEMDITGIDGSIFYCPNPSGKFNILLLGGVGLLSTELFEGSRGSGTFTMHLGAAARIFFTDKLYIRPDFRYLDINGLDLGVDVNGLDLGFDVNSLGLDFDGTSPLTFTTTTVSIGWVFGK